MTQGARSREVVYVPWQTSLVEPTFERSCKVTVGALTYGVKLEDKVAEQSTEGLQR